MAWVFHKCCSLSMIERGKESTKVLYRRTRYRYPYDTVLKHFDIVTSFRQVAPQGDHPLDRDRGKRSSLIFHLQYQKSTATGSSYYSKVEYIKSISHSSPAPTGDLQLPQSRAKWSWSYCRRPLGAPPEAKVTRRGVASGSCSPL